MTATAYLVHLHQPFGHARHTGSNLLRHVNAAGVTWSLVRLWPGASRTVERQLHDRGGASRLCPVCESARRSVDLPGGGTLAPVLYPADPPRRCCAPRCAQPPTRLRPWAAGVRGLCELHACAYAARQHGGQPFTTSTA